MAIGEPGAVLLQTVEAAGAEERLPFADVIAAHLIEDDEDDELGFSGDVTPRLVPKLSLGTRLRLLGTGDGPVRTNGRDDKQHQADAQAPGITHGELR